MGRQIELSFDSIESAHNYIRLLSETVAETKRDVDHDLALAAAGEPSRRVEVLRIIGYSLEKLQRYLSVSSRTLNDLRSLRRLLFEERSRMTDGHSDPEEKW